MEERFKIIDKYILYDPWPDGFGYEASDLEDIFIKRGMGGWVEPFPILGAQSHAGMTWAPNGDLLLVFAGIRSDLRDGATSFIIRSTNKGKTWQSPEEFIIKGMIKGPGRKGVVGGLMTSSAGAILCPYCEFTTLPWKHKDWKDYKEKTGKEFVRKNLGLYLLKSVDNGKTWTKKKIQIPFEGAEIFPYGKIVELKNGRLLMVTQTHFGGSRSGVLKSDDGGETWGDFSTIGLPGDETPIIELPDEKLLAVNRAGVPGGVSGRLARHVSTNKGDSWSTHEPTVMTDWSDEVSTNGFPLLHKAPSGTLMLFYRIHHFKGTEKGNFGMAVSCSNDEGITWQGTLRLEDPKCNPGPFRVNIGGVDAVNLPDGKILVVISLLYKAKYMVINILEEI